MVHTPPYSKQICDYEVICWGRYPMLTITCILERIGGIAANKIYFRRIEDVEFAADNSWFKKYGQSLVKISRSVDVLPASDTGLLDRTLQVLSRQTPPSLVNGTIRCFKEQNIIVTELTIEGGKIVAIEEKVLRRA